MLERRVSELSDVHFICELVAKRQFTGLQDKSGVDIYEGDVLKQTYEDGDVFGVVKYVMAEAGYITEGINEIKDYPLCFNAYYSGKSEIVGNIHSNPELLETK